MTSSDSAEQEGAGSGMAYRGSTQKPGVAKFYPLALVSFLIVACIVITSLHNLLDTPLLAVFGIGKKYQVSTYGIDDPSTAALVMENDSPFHIHSIELTRHQDGSVYEFGSIPLEAEGAEVFPIEPGGYDLTVIYSNVPPGMTIGANDVVFYVDGIATAHFNVRKARAVIFHLEGGGMGTGVGGVPSYTPSELVGK